MIALEHVTKKYGSVTALRDVSFRAEKGRITGLLGRNGAGKTTALNLMAGYLAPTEGRVTVDGTDMAREPMACRRRIGYLPERPPLYDELTVREYLEFVCDLRQVLPREKKRHTEEILGLCGLEQHRDRLIGHLSKGYRQRTGIAQALCGNPEVLILDEPTVGLDPQQVAETRELIRKLGEEHTILFSSHMLPEVQQLCHRAVILHEGRVIREFDLREDSPEGEYRLRIRAAGDAGALLDAVRSLGCVRKAERLPETEPGTAEIRLTGRRQDERGRMTDQVFRLAAALDAPLRGMWQERNDLETVFLEATGS